METRVHSYVTVTGLSAHLLSYITVFKGSILFRSFLQYTIQIYMSGIKKALVVDVSGTMGIRGRRPEEIQARGPQVTVRR